MIIKSRIKSGGSRPKRKIGAIQQKILLLLLGGVALGLSGSPKTYFRIIGEMKKEWQKINRNSLRRAIQSLYKSKLVEVMPNKDNTSTFILSEKGKRLALTYNLNKIQLSVPKNWDGKWRIVMFDVPEKLKKLREILRYHLRTMGFLELQKSVFVHPSDCQKEIEYLIEFHNIRRFVRFLVVESIDTELHLKQRFGMMK